MIEVFIYSDGSGFTGFESKGHADFADAPFDIICSAVSVLTVNTANSVEKFSGSKVDSRSENGHLWCSFPEGLTDKGDLLMRSMILGLEGISKQYGDEYLQVRFIRRN